MRIVVTESFSESCELTAKMIADVIRLKHDARLGLATGDTAKYVYLYLVKCYKAGQIDFSKVSSINLDEYVGLAPDHPQSYRYFMDHNLFDHININKKNTYVVSGIGDIEKNIAEFNAELQKTIDIQLLGIGVNGHIGFNEPNIMLHDSAHVEVLDESTIHANSRFFENKRDVPRKAISMGIGDILRAKRLVIAATGREKADAIRGLIVGSGLKTSNPSTMIRVHPDATVIIDKELAHMAGYER
jgi:glucosamine-6-phosphate deaminase